MSNGVRLIFILIFRNRVKISILILIVNLIHFMELLKILIQAFSSPIASPNFLNIDSTINDCLGNFFIIILVINHFLKIFSGSITIPHFLYINGTVDLFLMISFILVLREKIFQNFTHFFQNHFLNILRNFLYI